MLEKSAINLDRNDEIPNYEIGEREPPLIADYVSEFLSLLMCKNNR